jgi:hypothetical protein
MGDVGTPLQNVLLPGEVTVGVGFTVMVNVCGVPVQGGVPVVLGVIVIVAEPVTGVNDGIDVTPV